MKNIFDVINKEYEAIQKLTLLFLQELYKKYKNQVLM